MGPIKRVNADRTLASECTASGGMLQLYFVQLWVAGLAAPRTADRATDSSQAAGPSSYPALRVFLPGLVL